MKMVDVREERRRTETEEERFSMVAPSPFSILEWNEVEVLSVFHTFSCCGLVRFKKKNETFPNGARVNAQKATTEEGEEV